MRAVLFLAAAFLSSGDAFAASTFPNKPARENFYADEAGLLTPDAGRRINEICWPLWKEQKIPLYVVTIQSLAAYGAQGQTIEGYARDLFNGWGVGSQRRNYGILLLISKEDRKARIELGSGWGRGHDAQADDVMNDLIVPQFRRGAYPEGIVAGVVGLNAMARGLGLPKPKADWRDLALWLVAGLFVVMIAHSLFKSGRSGWGWAFLAAVAVALFFLLRNAGKSSRGGFGGGSSGGGGSTGSW